MDRYDRPSRDSYRERDRDDRRRPSPGAGHIDRYVPGLESSAPITVNPLNDPFRMPFQVGFSYFGEWWRTNEKIKEERERAKSGRRSEPERPRGRETQEERDKEKARIQVAYDAYKEELQAKMANAFVQERKNDQWFQERYIAEVREPLRQQLNEFRRGNYATWENDFDTGIFDEFSLEGIPKNELNGAGGLVEKEEGETTAVNEILGVGDLVPMKGSDIRDETAFQPTLLIKTIAPHVSRDKLIDFCKEHLGDGAGGFRWLSLSDPNPSKRYHRIGWVMLNESGEEAPAYRPEVKDEMDEGEDKAPTAQSTAEKALEAINGKQVKDETRGDFTCHVGVHSPPLAPRKKALWDLFSAPERINKDLTLAARLVNKFEEDFGSDFNGVAKIEARVEDLRANGMLKPALVTPKKKAPKQEDLDHDVGMDDGEEAEEGEEAEDDEDVDDEELLVKKKQLDLMVEYLRRVFNFCFFCVFESDSVHELTRKCPGGHLRRPRNTLTTAAKEAARASASGEPFPGKKREKEEDDEMKSPDGGRRFSRTGGGFNKAEQQLQRAFNWVRTFEEKILQILEPENIDVRKLGGKPVDEAVQDELSKYVKQEDEHKFRCKVPECTKLFKEEHFWRKHVEKRHPEWLENLKKDFELVNTYVSDPAHIAPSRSDANSNGHFPPSNGHQPSGTPRGFNLNQYGMNGSMPFPGSGAPFFNGGPNWDNRGGHPSRRPPGRFQEQRGPYDRRADTRRYGPDAGRLTPPGGKSGRPMGGAARWDGAAGATGPREAVAGRSLKSYEDLDAVAGGAGGELNY